MRTAQNIKRKQKKTEKYNSKRKALKKLYNRNKNQEKRKNIIYQLFKTIIHFFPDLFDRIRQIEDYRKKSDYELSELITAGIAMFLFKEGSRNALNNDRNEGNFFKNYKKIFKMRLLHMDTVDCVMRRLKENELEEPESVARFLNGFEIIGNNRF